MAIISGGNVIEGSELTRPLSFAGVPVDCVNGTYAGAAPHGAILIDSVNANQYQNAGTKVSPVWKLVTRAA